MPRSRRLVVAPPTPERTGPGRPRKLTHDRIIQAAIAVMEREGFAALSTRSLARELGTTSSTLYNYVSCIEDIEVEALRCLTAGLTLPTAKTGPALRAELLKHLLSVRALVLKHPRVPYPEKGSPSWNLLSEINAQWYAALEPFVAKPHVVVLACTALTGTVIALAERERISGPAKAFRRHKSADRWLGDVKLESVEEILRLLIDQLLPGLSRS